MRNLIYLASRRRRKGHGIPSMLLLVTGAIMLAPAVLAKSAADYFVHSLPGAPDGEPLVKMHAGHIEIDPTHHSNLFFWHFANTHLADRPRTVIWLNGGPGCSSEDGALMEVGPYRVRPGGKLEAIDGAWNEFANVLFVDNPVGTGFSYVDTNAYVHELKDMADQFVVFLEKWFDLFPHYQHDDIYIAGESYAGQHIPYVARAMLDRNKAHAGDPWNLKGLLIGNGWISGPDQYPSYLSFAYENGLIEAGSPAAMAVERQQSICFQELSDGGADQVDVPACEEVLQVLLQQTAIKQGEKNMCFNMYDVRLKDESPSCGMAWPPDLIDVTPYLRRHDVITALHVNPDKKTGWTECNGAVGSQFTVQNSEPSRKLLPDLLAQIPILLFSGDRDLICNHKGTEELINNLSFNSGKGFETNGLTAPRLDWVFEGEPAGIYQSARNLTYVKFFNSSHMVPFDYPRRTRDMLDRFMGVDIATVGGKPVDSVIGGEKSPQTSVGGHPNSTAAEQDQAARLREAELKAYYKSGEVVFVIVFIAAAAWVFFVWRARRKQQRLGYRNLPGGTANGALNPAFKDRTGSTADLEAADFDEAELDELEPRPIGEEAGYDSGRRTGNGNGRGDGISKGKARAPLGTDEERYSIGSDSDEPETDISRK